MRTLTCSSRACSVRWFTHTVFSCPCKEARTLLSPLPLFSGSHTVGVTFPSCPRSAGPGASPTAGVWLFSGDLHSGFSLVGSEGLCCGSAGGSSGAGRERCKGAVGFWRRGCAGAPDPARGRAAVGAPLRPGTFPLGHPWGAPGCRGDEVGRGALTVASAPRVPTWRWWTPS